MKNFLIKTKKACPAKLHLSRETSAKWERSGGFTLVETLVALIIFSSSIVGMIVILGGGISNTTFVKSKTVATYLSQEGIELARNLRDSYILNMNAMGWTKFSTLMGGCSNGCDISSDSSSSAMYGVLVTSSKIPLNYSKNTGFYDYSSTNNPSLYTRTIRVTQMGSSDELNIKSEVTWDYQGKSYSVESSENLFNWQ